MIRFKKIIALLIVFATVLSVFSLIPALKVNAAGTETPFYDWKQYDPQWKDVYIGNNTIGNIGCYVTSAAMLIVYGGLRTEADFDPATLVSELKAVGGFAGNLIYKGKINKAVKGFDYHSEVLLGKTKAEKTESISYYLNKGYYIVAGVKNLGHYVAIREVKDGVVYMMDPASESTVLFDYYAVSGVTKIFLYTSTGKKVNINDGNSNVGSTTPDKTYVKGIYKTTDDLNLREEATTASTALTVIPEGTEITVTEIDGGWGKVTYNGEEGYVYLEYTTLISETKDPSELSSEEPSEEPSSEEESSEEPSEEPSSEEESSEEPSEEPSSEEESRDDSSDGNTSGDTGEEPTDYVPGKYVLTGSVYLREGPSSSYSKLTAIPKGAEIEVTEILNEKWGKTTYNGYEGYCGLSYSKLLEAFEEPREEIPVSTTTKGQDVTVDCPEAPYYKGYYVTTANLSLRASNTTSAERLAIIPNDTTVKVTEIKNGWGKVTYNQISGWCSLEYCEYKESYIEETFLSADGIVGVLSEEADLSRLCVITRFSDGSSYIVYSNIQVSYVIPTAPSVVKATAKYEGVEYSFNILYVDSCKVLTESEETYVVVPTTEKAENVFADSSVEIKTSFVGEIDGINFTVIFLGDVDGSGDISTTDYLKIKQGFMDYSSLNKTSFLAADVNEDGSITTTDYLYLKSFLLNK